MGVVARVHRVSRKDRIVVGLAEASPSQVSGAYPTGVLRVEGVKAGEQPGGVCRWAGTTQNSKELGT